MINMLQTLYNGKMADINSAMAGRFLFAIAIKE